MSLQDEKKIKVEQQQPVSKLDWKIILSHKWVVKNVPFFLFLAVLAVLYIYNGHLADKLSRKIAATEKQIQELEYKYKSVKSEVIFRSKSSELVRVVEPLGLKELVRPPIVLTDSTETKTQE